MVRRFLSIHGCLSRVSRDSEDEIAMGFDELISTMIDTARMAPLINFFRIV